MSTTVITFFNNKGGVGKTSLVYHLACMYADLELRVVAADLDPQANLTAAFLDDDMLELLWPGNEHPRTLFGFIQPLLRGTGDVSEPHLEQINDNLVLLAGDLSLSGFEDELSQQWPQCMDRKERAFRIMSSFWRIIQEAARKHTADVILVDLGPNLGAINRAALISTNYVVVPLAPDLFSLQGLRNLGPTLRRWRIEWQERKEKNPVPDLIIPQGSMETIGYIMMQHSVRLDRPVKAYDRWIAQVPGVYRKSILDEKENAEVSISDDTNCLALLKHYRSLMPMAQEANKPMFFLKPSDGAIGSHMEAVRGAYQDFKKLARKIAERAGISAP